MVLSECSKVAHEAYHKHCEGDGNPADYAFALFFHLLCLLSLVSFALAIDLLAILAHDMCIINRWVLFVPTIRFI